MLSPRIPILQPILLLAALPGLPGTCSAAPPASQPQGAGTLAAPAPPRAAPATPRATTAPEVADTLYPRYMPMTGLRRPAVKLTVRCDASRAAGREVYAGRDAASLYGRVEGGFEFVYEATDSTGAPCVYPFAPWLPQITGSLQGAQFILRSSVPGRQVTFRSGDEWASIGLHIYDIGQNRVHFEMRDIALDFPGAIQPQGALHLEGFGGTRPGLFTAVVRRSRIYGGKNALFVPPGQTMLFVEDSDLAGNVGTSADQMHTTYINGILVSHMRNSVWRGQHAWANMASGHQLKDKAYLRIYENVTVSNWPTGTTASAMPLIDASSFGFTWSDGLTLERAQPAQDPREGLVDLRSEIVYGPPQNYPWNLMADPGWTMPANPLTALDKVYLSVFFNTRVRSFRNEPFVFALRPQGLGVTPGTTTVVGNDQTTRAQQRMVALAFGTSGNFRRVFAPQGWTYVDPQLPPDAQWVTNRDAFAAHALALIGR